MRQAGIKTIICYGLLLAVSLPLPTHAADFKTLSTYKDKLIDPDIADEAFGTEEEQKEKQGVFADLPPGFITGEYQIYNSNLSGDEAIKRRESGFGIRAQQQTLGWGRIDFTGASTSESANPGEGFGSGKQLRLSQRDFVVHNNWRMNNHAGHHRVESPRVVVNSQHRRLPQPLIDGVSSQASRQRLTLYAASGKLGNQRGRTFTVFDDSQTSGDATGLAADYQIDRHWSTGLQWWDIDDTSSGLTSSHTTLVGAAKYTNPENQLFNELHFLNNDNGSTGLWIDGALRYRSWRYQYGLFSLDPDLAWVNSTANITSDRQGGYWRGDRRRNRFSGGLGLEHYKTNIDSDPTLAKRSVDTIYGTGHYRLTRKTSISGSGNFQNEDSQALMLDTSQDRLTLSSALRHDFELGVSAWELTLTDTTGENESNRQDWSWDHDWKLPSIFKLRTGISRQTEQRPDIDLDQTSLRVSGGFVDTGLSVSGSLSHATGGSGISTNGKSSDANLNVTWQFARGWQMAFDYSWNENKSELVNNIETLVTDKSLLFSLRYTQPWGSQKSVYGNKTRFNGIGTLQGKVFMDSNGNGIQESNEAGMPQITVRLDGNYTVETDATGSYRFFPVTSGKHNVTVDVINAPLPWSLKDEVPQPISIQTRQTTTINIGLIDPNKTPLE